MSESTKQISIFTEDANSRDHGERFVSGTSLMVRPRSQSAEILVRPDCKEETLISLVEQVLFSLGGRMGKRYPEDAVAHNLPPGSVVYCPMLMVASSHENSIWNEITAVIGANRDLQRIVFINVGSSKSLTYTPKQIAELSSFAADLFDHLYTALNANQVVDYNAIDVTPLSASMPDCILDLGYIRDLQGAVAQNMNERLTEEVTKIDEAMKSYELKCARLMTLLKPTYVRAALNLPSVPEKVSLASYPLTLKRSSSVRDINAELTRLMLLRARRNYREFVQARKVTAGEKRFDMVQLGVHTFSSEDYDKYGCQVAFILNDLQQQLSQWAAEEYGVRVQRKIVSVKDRYEALRRFKIQLLLTLHDRFSASSAVNNAGLLQSWGFSMISADKKLQLSVQEKFSFVDESQPLLVDAMGQVDGRKGNVYLTLSHFFSYSAHAILGGLPTMVVIPFSSMKTLELFMGSKLLSSVSYPPPSKDPVSPTKARIITKGPGDDDARVELSSLSGAYSIRVVDFSGISYEIQFAESTADFAVRVFDVIDFIIKEKLFMVTEYQPSQRRQFMKTEEEMVETSLEDLGDMLEITFERTEDETQKNQTPHAEDRKDNLSSREIEKVTGETVESSGHSDRPSSQQPSIPKEEQLLDMDFDFSEPSPQPQAKPASAFDLFDSLSFASSAAPVPDSTKIPTVNNTAPSVQKIAAVPLYPSPSSVSASASASSPPAPAPALAPAPAPAPAPASNKRLASNIQKFLQQSQQQKKEG